MNRILEIDTLNRSRASSDVINAICRAVRMSGSSIRRSGQPQAIALGATSRSARGPRAVQVRATSAVWRWRWCSRAEVIHTGSKAVKNSGLRLTQRS